MICYILLLLAPYAVLGSKSFLIEDAEEQPTPEPATPEPARPDNCCACRDPHDDSEDESDSDSGDVGDDVPAPTPTPAPKITPKFHYIHWVRQPFEASTVYDCSNACSRDKRENGDCQTSEYDFNYKTCYLYKEPYQNPGPYSSFTKGDRFHWAKFNLALPYYRTAHEQAGLLKLVLQEWWNVSDEELENNYTAEGEALLSRDEKDVLDFQLSQSVLIQRLIDDWEEYWQPKDEMITLIRKITGKNFKMGDRLVEKVDSRIKQLSQDAKDKEAMRGPDYVGPRRLLAFGEESA